jgi:hypothetical protein
VNGLHVSGDIAGGPGVLVDLDVLAGCALAVHVEVGRRRTNLPHVEDAFVREAPGVVVERDGLLLVGLVRDVLGGAQLVDEVLDRTVIGDRGGHLLSSTSSSA